MQHNRHRYLSLTGVYSYNLISNQSFSCFVVNWFSNTPIAIFSRLTINKQTGLSCANICIDTLMSDRSLVDYHHDTGYRPCSVLQLQLHVQLNFRVKSLTYFIDTGQLQIESLFWITFLIILSPEPISPPCVQLCQQQSYEMTSGYYTEPGVVQLLEERG